MIDIKQFEGYTPGSWAISFSQQGYPYQITAPNADRAKPGGIVDVTRWAAIGLPSSPEGQANARLIAAAPDLLRELKEARELVKVLMEEIHNLSEVGLDAVDYVGLANYASRENEAKKLVRDATDIAIARAKEAGYV